MQVTTGSIFCHLLPEKEDTVDRMVDILFIKI